MTTRNTLLRASLLSILSLSGVVAGCGEAVEASTALSSQESPKARPGSVSAEEAAKLTAAAKSPEGMVEIPAGQVTIDGKVVPVKPFLMDRFEVTNREFQAFVRATGYVSESERIGNSVVFLHGNPAQKLHPFEVVKGASWRHPAGPGSDIRGKADHPVTHISWNDAMVYAKWCDKRLATRLEWIHAASGGQEGQLYPWGNELMPRQRYMMNHWQGDFPVEDRGLDGYRGTAPVGTFPPNAFGLHDVAGNVWEWLGERATVGDGPDDELAEKRGGSFLCRENAVRGFHACHGYQLDKYEWSPISNGNDNIGFRCVRSLDDE